MDVGIALPNTIPGATGEQLLEWARRAEGRGFSTLGEEIAGGIANGAAKDAETVKQYLAAYEEAGCDELVFCPSSADAKQVDLLADAAGL